MRDIVGQILSGMKALFHCTDARSETERVPRADVEGECQTLESVAMLGSMESGVGGDHRRCLIVTPPL